MLNDEICKLRDKLNQSIINEEDYSITYQISVELDELIAQYYRQENKKITPIKELRYRKNKDKVLSKI